MNNAILEVIISQGIWTLLSFLLIYYIIKSQEKRDLIQDKRESNYQNIISKLSNKFELIHSEIQEIKNNLNKFS